MTKIELLPWLQLIYDRYGTPRVKPNPSWGVRFLLEDRWVVRQTWLWIVGITHYTVSIDRYSDHYETVAGCNDYTKPIRGSLTTREPPTDDQVMSVLTLTEFLR